MCPLFYLNIWPCPPIFVTEASILSADVLQKKYTLIPKTTWFLEGSSDKDFFYKKWLQNSPAARLNDQKFTRSTKKVSFWAHFPAFSSICGIFRFSVDFTIVSSGTKPSWLAAQAGFKRTLEFRTLRKLRLRRQFRRLRNPITKA